MVENEWTLLPYPFSDMATEVPVSAIALQCLLAHLLEDGAGLARILAAAVQNPDCDQDDVKYATRLLAEHLHATVAQWRL